MEPALRKKIWIAAGTVIVLVVAMTLAWRFTALRDIVTIENVVEWIETFSSKWWAPLVVVLLYTPAALILFPRALLTLAAAIVFGPVKGFFLAMAGVLLSAWLLQFAGHFVEEKTVRRIAGKRIEPLKKLLQKQGFMAIAAVGFLPVAPFSVEMIVAGALRIPVVQLLLGVGLAHLPGTVFTTLLGDQAVAAMSEGRQVNHAVIAGVVIAFIALGFWTRRYWQRIQAQVA
jgi:uncharacterized membrane protein YdjX (TVP38/TMEM64 family)